MVLLLLDAHGPHWLCADCAHLAAGTLDDTATQPSSSSSREPVDADPDDPLTPSTRRYQAARERLEAALALGWHPRR